MSNKTKIESIAEFLARGGKITSVAACLTSKSKRRQAKPKTELTQEDMSLLPVALKIKYGIKS